MKQNYEKIMDFIYVEEGGFVNNPNDKGGATNKGITIKTLSAHFGRAATVNDVKNLSTFTANEIYRKEYWNKIVGDQLPSGVDYTVMDMAVHSGVSRSAKFLQRIVGVNQDGLIGAKTIQAVNNFIKAYSAKILIERFNTDRQKWLETLRDFKHFGRGWSARVKRVQSRSVDMVVGNSVKSTPVVNTSGSHKAEQSTTSVDAILKKPEALLPILTAGGGLVSAVAQSPILSTALAVAGLVAVGIGVYYFVKRVRSED